MFKWYADITELDEAAVTPSALRRIYFLLVLSVPFLPLMALGHLDAMQGGVIVRSFYWVTFIISAVATACLFLTRIINRVWVQDQYLDEWEKVVKHKSMSVGFMVLTYTLAILFGFGFVYHDLVDGNLPDINSEILGFVAIGAVFFGIYVQIFQQLAMMRPMDEDVLSEGETERVSFRPVITGIALAILVPLLLLVVGAFVAGYIDGLMTPLADVN